MADNVKKDERIDGVRYITIPVRDTLDDEGLRLAIEQLAPTPTNVVGNYADIQRGGAAVVHGEGSMSDGVETPPGVTDDDLATSRAVETAVRDAQDANTGQNSVGDSNTGDTGGTKASRKTQ